MNRELETTAAVEAGVASASLHSRMTTIEMPDGGSSIPLVLVNDDQELVVPSDLLNAIDERQPCPRRKSGTSTHHRSDSFIDHVNRNKTAQSVIWADIDQVQIAAIYNYHGAEVDSESDARGAPGWRDYKALYVMPLSEQWQQWVSQDGEAMSQDHFADWLDTHDKDIASDTGYPKSIELIELARNLQVHTKGTFSRQTDPTTGQHSLICKEEHTEKSTKIPRAFLLGIPIFRSGVNYQIECRVAFRMVGGTPYFSYSIYQRAENLLDAFDGVVGQIGTACEEVPVFWGQAE